MENIGRYELSDRSYIEKNGDPIDPIADETVVYTSYSLREADMGDDWANYISEYGLPTLSTNQMTQLGFTMDDVAQITIGTNDITWEENQFRDTEETATEVRVEYFRIVEPGDDEYWSPWYGISVQ